MDLEHQFRDVRRAEAQRNIVAAIAAVAVLADVGLILFSATRTEQVILAPVIQSPLEISSSHVSRDYLELVTRDTAYAVLNRTPQTLDYWMNSVLKITDPAFYGPVKARLLRASAALRGSDTTQVLSIYSIDVAPDRLSSEVTGSLAIYVGQRQVSATPVRYFFDWTYRGLSLKLSGFGEVKDPSKQPQPDATDAFVERGGK